MFKMFVCTKRKPGMSMEAFRDYYENHHSKLAMSISPLMRGYQRNYLTPFPNDGGEEPPFDCIAEVTFDSEEDFKKNMEGFLNNPEKLEMINKDEENLFDRPKIRSYTAVQTKSKF